MRGISEFWKKKYIWCGFLFALTFIKNVLLLAISYFQVCFAYTLPKRRCHCLYNCEYMSIKVISIIFYLRIALILLIDQWFLQFYMNFQIRVPSKKTPRNYIDLVGKISRLFTFTFVRACHLVRNIIFLCVKMPSSDMQLLTISH